MMDGLGPGGVVVVLMLASLMSSFVRAHTPGRALARELSDSNGAAECLAPAADAPYEVRAEPCAVRGGHRERDRAGGSVTFRVPAADGARFRAHLVRGVDGWGEALSRPVRIT